MPSRQEELRERTKTFAIRVISLLRMLPRGNPPSAIRNQLLRSATSVAANYRSCNRARSRREFAAKIAVVLEESDETVFWIELLEETAQSHGPEIRELLAESRELVSIFSASHRTASAPRRSLRPATTLPDSAKRTPDRPITR